VPQGGAVGEVVESNVENFPVGGFVQSDNMSG
jgi:hypothetical protein